MFLNRHLIFLYVTMAVSVGYFISAVSLGAPFLDSGLTPSFFPILVGAAAIVFAGILIVNALRAGPDEDAAPEQGGHTHLWVVVAIFFYILVFRPVGYFISSGVFVFSLILLFSSLEKLVQKAIISPVIVGLAYAMFQHLFGVRLPGLWG